MGGQSSGSYAPVHGGGGAADSKLVWLVLGVIAAVAIIVIVAVSLRGGGDGGGEGGGDTDGGSTASQGYTPAVETAFTTSCEAETTAGGATADAASSACACAFDEISRTIPFEEFRAIDEALADGAPQTDYPELTSIMTECVSDL
jgi:hypothetical protein